MADAVTSQLIDNGPRNLVMKFTNLSDGTGETGVKKVDAQSSTYAVQGVVPGVHLKVTDIEYDVHGMELRVQWDATTPVDMLVLADIGMRSYKSFAGLPNPMTTGSTGSILFTTVGASSGSSYSVIMKMTKNVPQS